MKTLRNEPRKRDMRPRMVLTMRMATALSAAMFLGLGWSGSPALGKVAAAAVGAVLLVMTCNKRYEQALIATIACTATGIAFMVGMWLLTTNEPTAKIVTSGIICLILACAGAPIASHKTNRVVREARRNLRS